MTIAARPFGRLDGAGAMMRLRAHRALHVAAREAEGAGSSGDSAVTSEPVPQGGADVARITRERFRAEARAIVVEAASRFGRTSDPD